MMFRKFAANAALVVFILSAAVLMAAGIFTRIASEIEIWSEDNSWTTAVCLGLLIAAAVAYIRQRIAKTPERT